MPSTAELSGPPAVETRVAAATPVTKSDRKIFWLPAMIIISIHVGALLVFVPALFSWPALATAVVVQTICSTGGITLGFHRLLTHRSFKTYKPIEHLLSFLGSLNLQGGPIKWVAIHRMHHQHSDQDGDPHSPKHGFFWGHMICYMTWNPKIDAYENYSQYAKDLARDRVHVVIDRTEPFTQVFLAMALYAWGEWVLGELGWSCVIWAGFARLVYSYHITWLVNSAAHTWGYRTYETTDDSRNLWWVGLLSHGEGWHNNHHAYPRSARHGLKPWEIDTTWMTICVMKALGLAWDIRLPDEGASRDFRPQPSDANDAPPAPES